MIWPDPTHQHTQTHPPTHPPNYTPTLGWGSLHRFQILKQNWNISISSSAIEFWLIPGVPRGVGGVGVWGCGVVRGCPHTCTHACTRMHTHARAHAYDIIGNSHGFPQWGRPFAWNYHVYHAYMCVHVRACMYVHVHVCGGYPHPIHPPPPPRATGSLKHQNSITLELIEIIRFCLKILYLWTFLNSYKDYSWSHWIPPTHLPNPPELRKPKSEELE